jgi:pectinesterase
VDCSFYETLHDALVWHDGSKNKDQKFVMVHCKFDGVEGFNIARHHHDGAFYFINAEFGGNMIDKPPFRVIYPLDGSKPTAADIQNNKQHDATNIWGERSYYFNSHRDGGDYRWMADNLDRADGSPRPEQITAAWTFGGTWNPEDQSGPTIQSISVNGGKVVIKFSESVTVRGAPKLNEADGVATYAGGSGSDRLTFAAAPSAGSADIGSIDLNGGEIFATLASAETRMAKLTLPKKS